MTEKELNQLVTLLVKLKDEDLYPPKTPYKVWKELVTILPAPAVEVLITRNDKEFLLTKRNDKNWQGWHIPGGFMLAKERVEQACNRLAQKELGTRVKLKKVQNIYVWQNHPYANAISIICICEFKGKPKKGKFFQEIPEDVIPQHKNFIENYFDQIK